MTAPEKLFTIKEASAWATEFLGKTVTPSNITYLLNYGRINKVGSNGNTLIAQSELQTYYAEQQRETLWTQQLGDDLNWTLAFDQYKEAETTKHVHRLHPYKGKFIPQLVEYFLDSHTDAFKREVFFQTGDIVLDPFCGSGTTLVQAQELGLHAIGIDVSRFNALIANVKVQNVNFTELAVQVNEITRRLQDFVARQNLAAFEQELTEFLSDYNDKFFPSPEHKIKVRTHERNEKEYARLHEPLVTEKFNQLVQAHGIKTTQEGQARFLEKWFLAPVRAEIDFVHAQIERVANEATKNILTVILSRTLRSCRATTHSDLATLLEPVTQPYYCAKHGKICKPLFSIVSWWERYSKDTITRLGKFAQLKTGTQQVCLNGNSETLDIFATLEGINPDFAAFARTQKIKGIFSSPPYVGLIDYHEQHAYAYDLFGFERHDAQEIGALSKKQSKAARTAYIDGIANVLGNAQRFLVSEFHIFLVANDKYNLYLQIAEKAGLRIVNQYKRPVLNRTERDQQAYMETIFHLMKI